MQHRWSDPAVFLLGPWLIGLDTLFPPLGTVPYLFRVRFDC